VFNFSAVCGKGQSSFVSRVEVNLGTVKFVVRPEDCGTVDPAFSLTPCLSWSTYLEIMLSLQKHSSQNLLVFATILKVKHILR